MAEDSHVPPLPRRARGDAPRLPGPEPPARPLVLPEPVVQHILSVLDAIRAEASPHCRPAPGRAASPGPPISCYAASIAAAAGAGHGHRAGAARADIASGAAGLRAALAVGGSANGAAHGHRHIPGKRGHKPEHGRAGYRGAARACHRRASQRQGDPCSARSRQNSGRIGLSARARHRPAPGKRGPAPGKGRRGGTTCRPALLKRRPVVRKR